MVLMQQDCRPFGIAIDSNNMVYVSEDGNNRVSVFNLEGHRLGGRGQGQESLMVLVG